MPEISRRAFLGSSAVATAGLVVGCGGRGARVVRPSDLGDAADFGPLIMITPEDEIVVLSDKVEMGQGTLTLYATLVAEELEVDPGRIEVRHASIDPRFGIMQMTGGSNTAKTQHEKVRRAAAEVRERLRLAAAEAWDVEREDVRAQDGVLSLASSGRSATYGEFAEAATRVSVPSGIELKPASEFRVLGRKVVRPDAPAKVRGEARYGLDVRVEGMRYASILRPPVRGDGVARFDPASALAVRGVLGVFEVPSGVAVVAENTWAARRGVAALEVEFTPGDGPRPNSVAIRAEQERILSEERGREHVDEGDVEDAIDRAAASLDVRYFTPHQAHATMEPLNCTIVPRDGSFDVHLGTQGPNGIQDNVAAVLGVARDDVRVHVEMLGGGFGRRSFTDVAIECAEIVRRTGEPVKLVWSREDDHSHDFYRPASGHRLRGGVGEDGELLAWDHVVVVPSLLPSMGKGMLGSIAPESLRGVANAIGDRMMNAVPRLVGPILGLEGANEIAYDAESRRLGSVVHDPGVRVGIWRSVGHSNNGFVIESFADELAHAAGEDPLAFRRRMLADHPRHLACLDLVERHASWGAPAPGRTQGVAVYESFDSVVAHVAEVSVEGDAFRVERVVCAVHCGQALNPDVVRAQIAGGTVFGLTAAIKSAVHFVDGVPQETNFDRYAMIRNHESPEVEVHIVPSDDPPTGVGEPGTPGIAAAVANALYAATGKRLRELPLRLEA